MNKATLASKIIESLRQAVDTLRSHKMRSALVILGVGIGVTTLMGMVTILMGLGDKISQDLRSSDNTVIYVSKFDILVGGDRRRYAHRPELEPLDLAAIREDLPSVKFADFQQNPQWRTILGYEGEKTGLVAVVGATTHFPMIFNISIRLGRNITQHEEEHSARVCLLGDGPAEDLFPAVDPIGKRLRIRGEAYTVVGVFDKRNHLFGGLADDFVLVPYTSFRKEWGSENDQVVMAVVPREGHTLQETSDDITALMRSRHSLRPGEEDDFALSSADAVEELVGRVTGPIGLVLAVIASIGLMVGGIGVMAIMLVSVTERTREIGIRKSLGATRMDILYQFLVEAASLTGLGGIAGVLAGTALAQGIAAAIGLPASTSASWTLGAVLFSAGIGIIFGLYPALRAARLDPVEAMRNE
jgi:putative ABC transport system permease protein